MVALITVGILCVISFCLGHWLGSRDRKVLDAQMRIRGGNEEERPPDP